MIKTYETAISRFNAFGYSKTCELVSVGSGKFTARCKECGHEFERDMSIISNKNKKQKSLRCPKCYEKLQSDVLDYYAAGHSSIECAEKFCITKAMVQNFAKKHCVSGGMSKERQGEIAREHQKKASAESAKRAHERKRARDNEKRIQSEFKAIKEDISNWRKTLDVYESLKVIVSSERKEFNNWLNGEYYFYKSRLVEYEPQLATCKHCGKEWLFWPSHEKYGRRNPSVFCSVRCNHNHHYNRETNNHRQRARKYGVDYESGITLAKIEKRDGGICYLCGGKTSRNDRWTTQDGYQGIGALYPTQEHVIPMARGGGHTSDNVRLAHKRCNELKGDKLLSELVLPFDIPKGE